MRITTLNLQGYFYWNERQPAIVRYLSDMNPDVILFQEDVYLPHISPFTPSAELNKALNFTVHHSVISRMQQSPSTPHYREGLAMLSQLPVVASQTVVLKQDPRDEHERIMQCFDVQTEDGVIGFANIHLSIEDDYPFSATQLEEVLTILDGRSEQRIIGGDFNIQDLEALRSLWEKDYNATLEPAYISYRADNKRVDYFLVPKKYSVTALAVSGNENLSDHCAVTIDITLQ